MTCWRPRSARPVAFAIRVATRESPPTSFDLGFIVDVPADPNLPASLLSETGDNVRRQIAGAGQESVTTLLGNRFRD